MIKLTSTILLLLSAGCMTSSVADGWTQQAIQAATGHQRSMVQVMVVGGTRDRG